MYQSDWIILRDTEGNIVARFDDWISYTITHRINGIDDATLILDGHNPNILLFGLDYFVEYWRSNKESNIEAYREAVTLHRTFNYDYDQKGQLTYMSHSVGLDDFLNRRIIYNYAGDARCTKSDAAETVIKEYVEEQAGPSATVAGGRLAEGAIDGLTVEIDTGAGDNWDGSRAWRNLLEVITEIAEAKAMAFRIEPMDLTVPSFIFRCKEKPYGDDRSSTGIDPDTGRNTAGNYPVIFSDQFGTAISPKYGVIRDTEANVAVVLGRGNEDERNIREKTLAGTSYETDSPWNRREIPVHATQETSDAGLDDRGDETLFTTIPTTIVDLQIVQHPSCMYSREYFLGDIVTCRVSGLEVNRTITEVTIKVEGSNRSFGEQIDITVSE